MNFVVIGKIPSGNLYNYAYSQIESLNNSIFIKGINLSFCAKVLMKLHSSKKINGIIELPYRNIWVDKYIKQIRHSIDLKFGNNDNICFILFSDCIEYEKFEFSKKLRANFNGCKIIYFFQDLVCKDLNKGVFLENNRDFVDLIYTFDCNDAHRYNLKFHNIPYSDMNYMSAHADIKYDISFVGLAKDRLSDIVNAFECLDKQGLKCGFFIVGVPKAEQKYKDKIHYCKPIAYKEYLKIVSESKCILEIMQKGGTGNTIRVSEAIAFNKLLISNNKYLLENSFYDSKYMRVFESLENFDVKSFIDSVGKVEYENRERIYPSKFLEQIEKDLAELDK